MRTVDFAFNNYSKPKVVQKYLIWEKSSGLMEPPYASSVYSAPASFYDSIRICSEKLCQ